MEQRQENLKLHLVRNLPMCQWDLYIVGRTHPLSRERLVALPIEFEEQEGLHQVIPCASLNDEEVQSIMNELWTDGVRPDKGIMEPRNSEHMDKEIEWMRGVIDYLIYKE